MVGGVVLVVVCDGVGVGCKEMVKYWVDYIFWKVV